MTETPGKNHLSRRDFLRTAGAASLASAIPGSLGLHAAGSDAIKVGVIGCGGRGTGAAIDCLNAAPGVEVVALGDLLMERVESSYKKIKEAHPDKVKVPRERMFAGFDN